MQKAENVALQVVQVFKTSAKKTALLKSGIKDVSSQGKKKRYLVGLCETRFVERHVSIPVKHSKLGAKSFTKICSKTVQNAPKWSLQLVSEFSKIFRGNMPLDPLEPFFVPQLASN